MHRFPRSLVRNGALPLLASYGYHRGNWKKRRAKSYNALLNDEKAPVPAALR